MKSSRICAAVFTLILVGAIPSQSSAIDRVEGATISNLTGQTLYYSVRWGDGPWQSGTIAPFGFNTHYRRILKQNGQRTPRLQIRYDSDLSGVTTNRIRTLGKYPSPDANPRNFRRYGFRTEGPQSRFLRLR